MLAPWRMSVDAPGRLSRDGSTPAANHRGIQHRECTGQVVVDHLGTRPLFWLGGALLIAAGLLGVAFLGRIRLR